MKKILTACFAAFFAASNAFAINIVPKAGIDIPTSVSYQCGPDFDTRRGFNLGLEAGDDISDYFMWGAGVEYNFPRGLVGVDEAKFSFMPVYISLMFAPLKAYGKGSAKPYVRANVGFNVLASNELGSNMTGGLYYGGAIGAEYQNFVGELVAGRYTGKFETTADEEIKMTYMKIGFTLGYKIKI